MTLQVTDDAGGRGTDTATVTVNAPPEANAGADFRAFVGDDVPFDGSGSSDDDGDIASYVWEFGDGTRGEGATATHAYTMAGMFTATLTVEDDTGARGTDTRLVIVDERIPPVPERSGCALSPTTDGSPAPALALLLLVWGLVRRRP